MCVPFKQLSTVTWNWWGLFWRLFLGRWWNDRQLFLGTSVIGSAQASFQFKKYLRCIILFLHNIRSFTSGLKSVNSAFQTHRKEGNLHLPSTYYVPECDSGQSIALRWRTGKWGVLEQSCYTWQFTAFSSLYTMFFLIGHWLITNKVQSHYLKLVQILICWVIVLKLFLLQY